VTAGLSKRRRDDVTGDVTLHTMMASNGSSEFISFLADDDAAVHAMMKGAADNRTSSSLASDAEAARDNDDSCGDYNWPVLFLFTIVIAAIGTTQLLLTVNYK